MNKHYCKSIIKYNGHNFIYLEDIQCIDEVKKDKNLFSFDVYLVDNNCFTFSKETEKEAKDFRENILYELKVFSDGDDICVTLNSNVEDYYINNRDIEHLDVEGGFLKVFLRNGREYSIRFEDWDEAMDVHDQIIEELKQYYNL